MEPASERSELELTELRHEIAKLEVDTRLARHALLLDWYKAILAGFGGAGAVIAVMNAFGWL